MVCVAHPCCMLNGQYQQRTHWQRWLVPATSCSSVEWYTWYETWGAVTDMWGSPPYWVFFFFRRYAATAAQTWPSECQWKNLRSITPLTGIPWGRSSSWVKQTTQSTCPEMKPVTPKSYRNYSGRFLWTLLFLWIFKISIRTTFLWFLFSQMRCSNSHATTTVNRNFCGH